MMKSLRPLALLLAWTGAGASSLFSAVIWSDNFTSDTVGSAPVSDFTGNTTQDWTLVTTPGTPTPTGTATALINATGNPSNSLEVIDTGNISLSDKVNGIEMSTFSTTTAGSNVLKLSFDWSVASYVATTTSTQRFTLSLGSLANNSITIGFGDIGGTNAFYAGDIAAPSNTIANAIGGNGTTVAAGAAFGSYNSGGANSTSGFVHFDITYVAQSTTALITETNGANVFNFTVTGLTATDLSNASLNFFLQSGASGTSDASFDNIVVQVVPEPATNAMLGVGALGFLLFLRRLPRRADG